MNADSDPTNSVWATHPWVAANQNEIRFGAGVSVRAPLADWPTHLALVTALERLGFDSHWVPDHPAISPDCWAMLAALAVSTSRIRLGPLVTCVAYRSPVLLARLAADVDRLSAGRLILGMGCGWLEAEFGWLGLPYPPLSERQQMLAEAIEVVQGLWGTIPGTANPQDTASAARILGLAGTSSFTYHGTHYQLDRAWIRPGPVQQPRVPMMIAGGGERVTLRQVARYADAANLGLDSTPGAPGYADDVRRKLAVLRQHCVETDRPYESVLVTHFTNPVVLAETTTALEAKRAALPAVYQNVKGLFGTPADAIAHFQPLVEAGVRYFTVMLATYDDIETAHLLATSVAHALHR